MPAFLSPEILIMPLPIKGKRLEAISISKIRVMYQGSMSQSELHRCQKVSLRGNTGQGSSLNHSRETRLKHPAGNCCRPSQSPSCAKVPVRMPIQGPQPSVHISLEQLWPEKEKPFSWSLPFTVCALGCTAPGTLLHC